MYFVFFKIPNFRPAKGQLITRTIDMFLKGMKGYWIPEAPKSLEEEEEENNNENDKKE